MSLAVSSLSFARAPLAVREQLAFPQERQAALLRRLRALPGVRGAALLCTCNRTELYLTGDCGTPWRLLCREAGVRIPEAESVFVTLTGEDAARHLMEVACGLQSLLRGEDQILSQVRKAMDLAQEQDAADGELATLFRMAVTVGKQVRTQVPHPHGTPSAALRTQTLLSEELGSLAGRRVLVIGNGQMGRLTAETLQRAGASVTVTLRSYRHRETVVPAGCATISYEARMSLLKELDAVVSATTSPHYTVQRSQLEGLTHRLVLVDLAVPRDVEPACAELEGIRYYHLDDFGLSSEEDEAETRTVRALINTQMEEYGRWKRHQAQPERPFRFPMFVDLTGQRVVLVGGGRIAARRISTLRLFGCELVVIAPVLQAQPGSYTWIRRDYRRGDLEGAAMAIAATDSRAMNHQIGEDAKELGIPVSVADCEAECTFYFPAICTGDEVIAGVVSHGKNHHAAARAAKEIRRVLEELP